MITGIVSALAFSPSYTEGESFYAAGSFSPTPNNIALFSDSQSEVPIMFLGGGPRAGVTQVICFTFSKKVWLISLL